MKASVKADANTPRPGTSTGLFEKLLRWFAEIRLVANFLQPRHPASQFTAEQRVKDGADEAGAVATAIENAIGNLTIEKTITIPITAVKVDPGALIALDQEEIQRRRDLVRVLFNDFWSGAHDKPAAFVERLDQAEDYLNERLAANGETWRLDTETRAMLSLPPRSSSPD
jgi:hypothetical protein